MRNAFLCWPPEKHIIRLEPVVSSAGVLPCSPFLTLCPLSAVWLQVCFISGAVVLKGQFGILDIGPDSQVVSLGVLYHWRQFNTFHS